MQALVVNCQRNGLGVIRALGSKGVRVIAVDHARSAPGLRSRYAHRKEIVVKPAVDEEAFVAALADLGEKHREGNEQIFLIPTNDEYVLTLARYWERLEPWFEPVFETDTAILLQCMDKAQTYRLAVRTGVPTPRTLFSPVSAESLADMLLPAIVKPANRRDPENIRKGVVRLTVCRDLAALQAVTDALAAQEVPFVIQAFIPGGDDQLYTAGVFSYQGELCAAFTGRKIRQFPPRAGQCALGEIVNEPRIVEYSERLLRAAKFTGIAQVEFKKQDGEFYLLEINPRSWSWNSLATFSGVNLPWIGCQTVAGGQPKRAFQQRFEGTWHLCVEDLVHNVILESNATLGAVLRDARRADCHAYWDRSDVRPALGQVHGGAKAILSGLYRRLKGAAGRRS
ncbi:MAG: ATP-grasp domain-containing protein [Anaerolineae bacterium]|nr:ATP-grasp domain-containing protein [Anaerolineae bacterium]